MTVATDTNAPKSLSRGRIALQIAGFCVGCALIVWCASRAFHGGFNGFEKLRAADTTLVAALFVGTLGSILCAGFTFWSVARPIRHFSVVEMQAVNLMASLFNYAPVRLGLFLRCVFHWRVERMPAVDITAWLAGVAIVTLGSLGSALVAGLVQVAIGRSALALDALWIGTYGACLLAGSLLTIVVGRSALLKRFLKGGERVLTSPQALAQSLAFRTIDLSMWSLRMWAAAGIVGVTIGPAQAAMLAAVASLGAGNPLGRLGWREALVVLVAPFVLATNAQEQSSAAELETLTSQLALLESAAEAAVAIPLGALGALWCVRHMKRARLQVA